MVGSPTDRSLHQGREHSARRGGSPKCSRMRENLLGRALSRAPRRTGADGSNRSSPLPDNSPQPCATISAGSSSLALTTRAMAGLPNRPKLAPTARTLGTARRPSHAHEPRNDSRHALVRRERASVASRSPPACLRRRHDRHRQDRTATQPHARRPLGRRGLLLSRSPRRCEPAHREPRPGRAPVGRDLSRPVRPDAHLRLQSPIGRPRGRARDGRGEHRLGIQKHLGEHVGRTPRIYPRSFDSLVARHARSNVARASPLAGRRRLSPLAGRPLPRPGRAMRFG